MPLRRSKEWLAAQSGVAKGSVAAAMGLVVVAPANQKRGTEVTAKCHLRQLPRPLRAQRRLMCPFSRVRMMKICHLIWNCQIEFLLLL